MAGSGDCPVGEFKLVVTDGMVDGVVDVVVVVGGLRVAVGAVDSGCVVWGAAL